MRVYHLLSAENGLSDIALKRIRISRFADLNDPFELLAAKLDEKKFRKGLRSWRTEFNESNGLLCFSRSWENPVLWSHYASKHRGMCLGFELANEMAQPVQYTTDRVPIKFAEDDSEKGLALSFVKALLATKFEHWRYEDEVRVFVSLDAKTCEAGSYFYPFSDKLRLVEVILGPLCGLPISDIRALVRGTYARVAVTKSRLAFKWFKVVSDERSVREENEFWASKQKEKNAV